MPATNKTITCPICGQELIVVDHPTKPGRVVAYDNCQPGIGVVAVWESDKEPPKETTKKGAGEL